MHQGCASASVVKLPIDTCYHVPAHLLPHLLLCSVLPFALLQAQTPVSAHVLLIHYIAFMVHESRSQMVSKQSSMQVLQIVTTCELIRSMPACMCSMQQAGDSCRPQLDKQDCVIPWRLLLAQLQRQPLGPKCLHRISELGWPTAEYSISRLTANANAPLDACLLISGL